MNNLVQLAKECPGIMVTISVADLVEANNRLIAECLNAIDGERQKKDNETLMSREDVVKRLNISETTLWRWGKNGYLVPVNVGGIRRYKSTDIDAIAEGLR